MAFSCFVDYLFWSGRMRRRGLTHTPRITKQIASYARPCPWWCAGPCVAMKQREQRAFIIQKLHTPCGTPVTDFWTHVPWPLVHWVDVFGRLAWSTQSGVWFSGRGFLPRFSCCWDVIIWWSGMHDRGHASHSGDNIILLTLTKRPGMTWVYPQHVYIGLSPFRAIVANEGLYGSPSPRKCKKVIIPVVTINYWEGQPNVYSQNQLQPGDAFNWPSQTFCLAVDGFSGLGAMRTRLGSET